jgi:two-component system nitrate/nitrite sensor histidine kinase NarX
MLSHIGPLDDGLETRVAQRTRELASALEFSQEIVAQLDLKNLLQSVAERARTMSRSSAVSLCLLDESGTTLALAISSGNIAESTRPCRVLGRSLTDRVVGTGQTMVVEAPCMTCDLLLVQASRWSTVVPLRTGTTTLGALCVMRSSGKPFDDDETRALRLLANSAAIAITNARLVEAERCQAEQSAALAERERLAAALHDHLAQTLGFLNLKVDRVRELGMMGRFAEVEHELDRMKSAINVAYGQVRAALSGLREPLPSTTNLTQQLADCVAEMQKISGLTVDLAINDSSALRLSPVAQTQVLHIVREALVNVCRHAQVRQVRVIVQRAEGMARFVVEDDGCGFDIHAVAGDHHLGLTIMRTRAERSGGRLMIHSTPGTGTRVVACFPLEAPAE